FRDGVQEVSGEALAARERLLRGARAEGDADDRRALAGDLVQVAVADPARVAAHADEPRLEREHPDVVGQHPAADVIDYAVDAALAGRAHYDVNPLAGIPRIDDLVPSQGA